MSGQGAAIGAAVGATYGLATGKDPLKYAMIGGAVGGGGPSVLSALAPAAGPAVAGTTAGTGTTIAGTGGALTGAGASTATNTAFMAPAGVNAATAATTGPSGAIGVEAAKTGLFSGATPATNAAMQGQGLTQTTAIQRPLSLTSPGVEPGQGYEYTMGDRLDQVGQFTQQNPVLTQMALQTGQGLLQRPQRQVQPAGLLRGNQIQVQAPQYQVGIPQVTLI